MDSRRLPGKAMLSVLGRPLIAYLFERISYVRGLDDAILATSVASSDDPLADFAKSEGISLYRGSKEDVLGRFYGAASEASADALVRISGDCPLIDPQLVDEVIEFAEFSGAYVARNIIDRTLGFPRGMDVEYMTFEVLGWLNRNCTEESYREHVTLALYKEDTPFQVREYSAPEGASWDPHWRLCVDEQPDFELVKRIIQELHPQNPQFTLEDISDFLRKNPHIAAINAAVRQKEV